jgi:hypothetical protein
MAVGSQLCQQFTGTTTTALADGIGWDDIVKPVHQLGQGVQADGGVTILYDH